MYNSCQSHGRFLYVFAYCLAGFVVIPAGSVTAQVLRVSPGLAHMHKIAPFEETPTYEGTFRPTRFWSGVGVLTIANAGALVGLNALWYSDFDRGTFRFHDDWDNWAQQDKFGHLFTAYQLARVAGKYARWSGLSDSRSALFGGAVSWLFQLQIELLDGFSEGWGFSVTDVAANTVGSALGSLQIARPQTTWFTLKYSYHLTDYADADAGYFGNALKDYNGISYWLVIRPARIDSDLIPAWWPAWLGVTAGYSGDGMKHALSTPEYLHLRQYYLALDFDLLSSLDTPYAWLNTVANILSFIRIPAPALQLGSDLKWHWMYY